MYSTTKNQNLHFDLFHLVTSDDLKLAWGHQRLRRVHSIPRHDPCHFIAVVSAWYGWSQWWHTGKSSLWPAPRDVISNSQKKKSQNIRKLQHVAIKCRFRIENQTCSLGGKRQKADVNVGRRRDESALWASIVVFAAWWSWMTSWKKKQGTCSEYMEMITNIFNNWE